MREGKKKKLIREKEGTYKIIHILRLNLFFR